jgi:hypothetical protein
LLQIKKKMTCEEFIRNNRGINGPKDAPKDLPKDFLVELYDHFSEQAIRFPQLPASMSEKYSTQTLDSTNLKCAATPTPPVCSPAVTPAKPDPLPCLPVNNHGRSLIYWHQMHNPNDAN